MYLAPRTQPKSARKTELKPKHFVITANCRQRSKYRRYRSFRYAISVFCEKLQQPPGER
jgi:hypothetical protein